MKSVAIGFAYLCIYSTPIQFFFVGWIAKTIYSGDYSVFMFSTKEFLTLQLLAFHDWVYSWFWNAYLDFWWQFPALIMIVLKIFISTYLGYWILGKYKN